MLRNIRTVTHLTGRSCSLQIAIGCNNDVDDPSSSLSGDILRVVVTSDACDTIAFDTPIESNGGHGYVTDQWVHMALGVGRRGAHVLINGRETVSGYPMNGWGDQWTQSPGNLAFPNPLNFSEGVNPASNPTGTFGRIESIFENYEDNDVINRMVELSEGDHTFTANCQYCSYTDGWHGGFWSVMDTNGTLLAGGETDGLVNAPASDDDTFEAVPVSFTVAAGEPGVMVQITTGDARSNTAVQWWIDDGAGECNTCFGHCLSLRFHGGADSLFSLRFVRRRSCDLCLSSPLTAFHHGSRCCDRRRRDDLAEEGSGLPRWRWRAVHR